MFAGLQLVFFYYLREYTEQVKPRTVMYLAAVVVSKVLLIGNIQRHYEKS